MIHIFITRGTTTYDLLNFGGINLVRRGSLQLTEVFYGRDFKPAISTAKWTVGYNQALYQFIAGNEDTTRVLIAENTTPLFTGFLRPTTGVKFSGLGVGDAIEMEALDASVRLETTTEQELEKITWVDGWVVCRASGTHSLVHWLVDKTGWTGTLHAPDILRDVQVFTLRRGEDARKRLEEILFEYGHVPKTLADGSLAILPFAQETPVATDNFSATAGDIIRHLPLKLSDSKEKGVIVNYQNYRGTHQRVTTHTQQPEFILSHNEPHTYFTWDSGDIFFSKPDIKGLGEEYAFVDHEIEIRLEQRWYRHEWNWWTPWNPRHRWVRGGGWSYKIIWTAAGINYQGNFPMNDVLVGTIAAVTIDKLKFRLKLKNGSNWRSYFNSLWTADVDTWPYNSRHELVITQIIVRANIRFYEHLTGGGPETVSDADAPRVRTNVQTDRKLCHEITVQYLSDKDSAERLVWALHHHRFATRLDIQSQKVVALGEVVNVTHPGRHLGALGRVVERKWSPGSSVMVYHYVVETLAPLQLSGVYIPPPLKIGGRTLPTLEEIAALLRGAVNPNGEITAPIIPAKIPSLDPVTQGTGLYFGSDGFGFYDSKERAWLFRVDSGGNVQFGDSATWVKFLIERDAAGEKTGNGTLEIKAKLLALLDSELRGKVKTGEGIQSDNYIPGRRGWGITGDGYAEFSHALIRGELIATEKAMIQGKVYEGPLISKNFQSLDTGWGLFPRGSAEFNEGLIIRAGKKDWLKIEERFVSHLTPVTVQGNRVAVSWDHLTLYTVDNNMIRVDSPTLSGSVSLPDFQPNDSININVSTSLGVTVFLGKGINVRLYLISPSLQIHTWSDWHTVMDGVQVPFEIEGQVYKYVGSGLFRWSGSSWSLFKANSAGVGTLDFGGPYRLGLQNSEAILFQFDGTDFVEVDRMGFIHNVGGISFVRTQDDENYYFWFGSICFKAFRGKLSLESLSPRRSIQNYVIGLSNSKIAFYESIEGALLHRTNQRSDDLNNVHLWWYGSELQLVWMESGTFIIRRAPLVSTAIQNNIPAPLGTAWREQRIILSNNVDEPANVINFASGQVFADDNVTKLVGLAMTKRLDFRWSAGSNVGGLDSGTKANSTWYSCWVIGRADGVTDYLFSASASSPRMPSGYSYKRRIGWVRTDANGVLLGFSQSGNKIFLSHFVLSTDIQFQLFRVAQLVLVPPTEVVAMLNCQIRDNLNHEVYAYVKGGYFPDVEPNAINQNIISPMAGRYTNYITELVTESCVFVRGSHSGLYMRLFTVGWEDLGI